MNALARSAPLLLGGLVAAGVLGAIVFAVVASSTLPDGPVDVVWDKAACAHCRMHLGEPAFAAQLTTTDGRTFLFDDPGCLFTWSAASQPTVHATWFHHRTEDRWLPASAVAFVAVDTSPMGFGLAAVDPGTTGALDLDAARARCAQRTGGGPDGTAGDSDGGHR